MRFLSLCGVRALGLEVQCPIRRFRADVAGYLDPLRVTERGRAAALAADERRGGIRKALTPTTIMVECKQSRADFLTDGRVATRLQAERAALDADRRALEERIIRHAEPSLRVGGSSLFADLEDWEFSRSRLASYRAIQMKLRRIDGQLHGQTKFWTLARYRLADLLILAAPRGLIAPREVPPGWGLLEVPVANLSGEDQSDECPVQMTQAPVRMNASEGARVKLLRNIAVAATIRARRADGERESGSSSRRTVFER